MALKRQAFVIPDMPVARARPAPRPAPPGRTWQEDRRDQGGGEVSDLLITRRQLDRAKEQGIFGGGRKIEPRIPRLPPQILNPPVIEKAKPPSVLDVINKIIFPQRKEEPVADVFGLPHLSDIASGVLDWGYQKVFGSGPPPVVQQQPNFYTGWSPLDSAPELISEGFSRAYEFSQDLNVGKTTTGGGAVATFLGCPVEEAEGCQPAKKRYAITIDEATGQCIKIKRLKSRKRRRRLASLSDIKDIAALKQVLGGGKALDTWIATRGR